MPKKIAPMTDTQIKNAKPQSKDYPIYDENGLLLLIKSTGTKIWQFRYYALLGAEALNLIKLVYQWRVCPQRVGET
jgi:hypothetical protein